MNAMSSRGDPGWCLRFLSGAVKGRTIVLKPGSNVLGSAGECDVMLPPGDVLPRHLVFTVGELVVSVQKVGTGSARLNGEEMKQQRKNVVAGDIISVGQIDVQLDHTYPAAAQVDPADDAWSESILPGDASPHLVPQAPVRSGGYRMAIAAMLAVMAGLVVVIASNKGGQAASSADAVNLAEVEKALAHFPEVEVVAAPGGQFSLKGYVESRLRKQALQQAMAPFGRHVNVHVHTAEDMVEQARRYVGDPAVAMTYAGKGRLVVSGTVEDEAVREKIRSLIEDLHPTVLVSDKVQYRPKPVSTQDTKPAEQWSAWQAILPARMVSITEDENGLRHIQLSNGTRYYEGSILRSGAEITRIEADGLVVSGGDEKRGK